MGGVARQARQQRWQARQHRGGTPAQRWQARRHRGSSARVNAESVGAGRLAYLLAVDLQRAARRTPPGAAVLPKAARVHLVALPATEQGPKHAASGGAALARRACHASVAALGSRRVVNRLVVWRPASANTAPIRCEVAPPAVRRHGLSSRSGRFTSGAMALSKLSDDTQRAIFRQLQPARPNQSDHRRGLRQRL